MSYSLSPPIDWSAGAIPGTTQNADPLAAGVAGSAGTALGTGTGQHGAVPLTNGGSGVSNAFTDLWDWLNEPFTTPLSGVDLFLIIGWILIALILWNLILFHIRIAAEAI